MQQLLTCGGDSMAYNRDDNLPCDLGSSGSQVWTTLERDMQWRTCLQVRGNGLDVGPAAWHTLRSSHCVLPAMQWAVSCCSSLHYTSVRLHSPCCGAGADCHVFAMSKPKVFFE